MADEWCAVPEEWESNLDQELPVVPGERQFNVDFAKAQPRDFQPLEGGCTCLEAQSEDPRKSKIIRLPSKGDAGPLFVDLDGDLPEALSGNSRRTLAPLHALQSL